MAFRVDIINIEDNVNNILLTDDLTIEILKVRYNWILNANVKNAVLGLDDYGLVWYGLLFDLVIFLDMFPLGSLLCHLPYNLML